MRLAIVTTHPIQYYAPVFKLLDQRGKIIIKVFYTWGEKAMDKHDPGFNKEVTWDIPLLEGYEYEWVDNISNDAGSHHFNGIINPNIFNQIDSFQANAVMVFGWAYSSHLKVLRHYKHRIPVFFRGDSTLLDEKGGIKSFLRHIFLRWVYRNIDYAFYTGINNKAYFKKFGLTEEQLVFAPHAVENDRFAADRKSEAISFRKDLGIAQNEVLILFAGKLEAKKSPLLLAESFLDLKIRNAHLLFVGNGALEGALKEKVRNTANIHCMDFQNQSEMPVVYQACDLFCLPSKGPGETWGLSVNEAMACGKAILVSDKVGCAPDLVKKDCNGAIFKSEDRAELAGKLHILTHSKALLKSYGESSNALIKKWNFLKIAEAIENKLNETIGSD